MEPTQPQIYLNPEPKFFPTLQWNPMNIALVFVVFPHFNVLFWESTASKSDDMSLIPEPTKWEEKLTRTGCPLTSTNMACLPSMHIQTSTCGPWTPLPWWEGRWTCESKSSWAGHSGVCSAAIRDCLNKVKQEPIPERSSLATICVCVCAYMYTLSANK